MATARLTTTTTKVPLPDMVEEDQHPIVAKIPTLTHPEEAIVLETLHPTDTDRLSSTALLP